MAHLARLYCLLGLTLTLISVTRAGFCTENYPCYKYCHNTVKTYTGCWLLLSCTEYRLETVTCADTCSRTVCCDGYTGDSCSSPICSPSCLNGGTCVSPNVCSCRTGYSTPYCSDINECYTSSNKCSHTCTNTPGSFKCSCNSGYRLLPDGYSCTDINECSEGTAGCEHDCTNTVGSFKCSCRDGYELPWWDQKYCQDIDECWSGTSGCEQQCTNTDGSFMCSCYSGYQLGIDGKSCDDIDECVNGDSVCDHYCENKPGYYTCGCNEGFVIAWDGFTCQDIDECVELNGGCNQTCVNELGSYHCTCEQGFEQYDGDTCSDIDECEMDMSGCSQNCRNTEGSFVCSCNPGYKLEEDSRTCSDVDDCTNVTCQNGGKCKDGLNSFTCICNAGFTSTHCETDINECLTFNGGCQENCTNTEGSFHCGCFEDHELQGDGFTCSGGDEGSDNVFKRFEIGGGLLPTACFVLPISPCMGASDADMQLLSTSEWYKQADDVYYTNGITYVESASLTLPLSLRGVEVTVSPGNCQISHTIDHNQDNAEIIASDGTFNSCKEMDFSESDIFDFISHESFFKTYLLYLSHSLPSWLAFEMSDASLLSIQDLKSELMYGNAVRETAWCSDAAVFDDHLYNVFRFDSSFLMNVLGEEIEMSLPDNGFKFCFITELCHESDRNVFFVIPEDAGRMLEDISVFQQLKRKYSLSVLPRVIGFSVVSDPASEVELWNGDTMFRYSQGLADLWIGGDISVDGNFWTINGGANIFFDVPDVSNILTSVHLDEWNIYANAQSTLSLKLRLFGKTFFIDFGHSDIQTYISVGGDQRTWCGENVNPQGMFFSVQLNLQTPFKGIPILENWQSSINFKAYALLTYEHFPLSLDVDIKTHITKLDKSADTLLELTTANFQPLRDANFLQNATLTQIDEIVKDTRSLKDLLQNVPTTNDLVALNDLRICFDDVWSKFLEIKDNAYLFQYKTEFIQQESLGHFKDLLIHEIDSFQETVTQALRNMTQFSITMATPFTGFGFKFAANLEVKGLNLGYFDIEFVYSIDSLFKCSRFDKVMEHMEGEEAWRILGRAAKQKKLNNFFNYEKGIGIGAAMSVNYDKYVFQLQVFAKLLGMKATGDLFLTNNGLYLYLEGNIWDIFLAQMDVSAEVGKKWHDLTFRVSGRFLAKAREERQVQTISSSFQGSYLDGLTNVIHFITDAAKQRIDQAQNKLSNAQNDLRKAQKWLEDKQSKVNQAHGAFDTAVSALETAKEWLEAAKRPFEVALEKLSKAQKNVDNLCKIRDCPKICIPGFKASICHKKFLGVQIQYPCFSSTDCMIKVPDLFCEAANLACRLVRSVAYAALELAKLYVRLPMLAFDYAKAAVSVAQVVVDKSRVVLNVAEILMGIAQVGLEFAITVLETAKLVLEGVKFALGAVANVLELVIEYGLKSIIDVKNCGFDIEISTKDLPVFAVFCDVNAFKLGWKTITIKINFKNILQSIWNAARATIDMLIKTFGNLLGIGRKRRDIAFESSAKIHASILRHVRDVGSETVFLNESLDVSYDIIGMASDIDQDYESRVLLYNEKCQKITVLLDFMQQSFDSLFDIVNESVHYLKEINDLKEELQEYTNDALTENQTLEDLGISKEHAKNDYNMTDDDLNQLFEEIIMSMKNDSLLNEISSTANLTIGNLDALLESTESINFVDTWFAAMKNESAKYFNASQCVGFEDCVFYVITTMYDLFEAENVPEIDEIRSAILNLENVIIELFQNETHAVSSVSESVIAVSSNVSYLSTVNPFCSTAPTFLTDIENQTVLNSTKVVFMCDATGDPAPQFWWLKDEEFIHGETHPNLTILSASVEDSGVYTCIASNVVANISSNDAVLLVLSHDDDECEEGKDECDHICVNVIGSYDCSCYEGYKLKEDKRTCFGKEEDVEEKANVTTIVIIGTAAFVCIVVVAGLAFVVHSQISKAKVIPSTEDDILFEKRGPPNVAFIESERSIGPMKTVFNKHAFSKTVGPLK